MIVDCTGKTLAVASGSDETTGDKAKEEVIQAEVDLDAARNKKVTEGPDMWFDIMADRRPEFYETLLTKGSSRIRNR
jgi:hypothetical protein